MSADSVPVVPQLSKGRSRVVNRSALLPNVDGRSVCPAYAGHPSRIAYALRW